ncbi:MAG: hypothetical protein HY744_29560 [Deltaproteobacteria bacterium]|nr:hypothetical protein [Deltaproteobacteria bacterium]
MTVRRQKLNELRREQRRDWAALTPAQRIRLLLELVAHARRTRHLHALVSRSDESTELLLAIKARLREADGRG